MMVELQPDLQIGKGLHRICYAHPEKPDQCIKIIVNGDGRESEREIRYYHRLQKRDISWDMLPRFYGDVQTSLGDGAVYDLIRDHDGQVSKTLAHYLEDSGRTEQIDAGLSEAWPQLKAYLLKYRVLTMSIKPKNVLYRKLPADKGRLVIVDNIGNSDLIPICHYSTYFAHLKIERKWMQFKRLLLKSYPTNQIMMRILEKS